MECTNASRLSDAVEHRMSHKSSDRHWHAAFVFSRHEKAISQQLTNLGLESYLPLYDAMHHWKGRKVQLSLPIFPNYIFVCLSSPERCHVLNLSSVVRIVSFNGHPAILPGEEIEALKQWIVARNAEPYPYVAEGKKVRVAFGPLRGLEGVIVRCKGGLRVIVSVPSIMRSVAFEVEKSDLQGVSD